MSPINRNPPEHVLSSRLCVASCRALSLPGISCCRLHSPLPSSRILPLFTTTADLR